MQPPQAIATSVGQLAMAFSFLETTLGVLIETYVTPDTPSAAQRGRCAILVARMSVPAKVSVFRALYGLSASKDDAKRVGELLDQVEPLERRRADLLHGLWSGALDSAEATVLRVKLRKSGYAQERASISSTEVDEINRSIVRLATELTELIRWVEDEE